MADLFTGNTDQFRQFVSVNRNYSMADLMPTLRSTTQTLLPRFLGDSLTDQLLELAGAPTDGQDPIEAKALLLARSAVARIGFATHVIFAEVQIDDDGITVSASEGRRAAFDYQTKELKRQLLELGWQSLDDLLKLIGANADLFPGWSTAPYQVEEADALFKNPAEFSRYYPIQDRWLTYWALRPFLQAVEEDAGETQLALINALPNTVSDSLKTRLRGKLLRALAYQAVLQAIPMLSIDINGANVQINYASQYGGNATYYTPPGRELLDWVLTNLRNQLDLYWQSYQDMLTGLQPTPDPADEATGGLIGEDGPFLMI